MKRLILSLLVLGLSLVAAPASAQEGSTKDNAQVEKLNSFIKDLRGAPRSINLCHLVDRYAKANRLFQESKDVVSRSLPYLDAKPGEILNLRGEAAYVLIERAVIEVRSSNPQANFCSSDHMTPGAYNRFEWTDWSNKYEVILAIRSLLDAHREDSRPWSLVIGEAELKEAVVEYASKEGPKFREEWKHNKSEFLPLAFSMLWRMLVEEGIAPSVLGLTAAETFEILEAGSRKHRGKS